jgi:hypothetical protein
MAKNSFTSMSESLLSMSGQEGAGSKSDGLRIIYPAIVRITDDYAGFNRIKAEIIEIDSEGKEKPGKDRNNVEGGEKVDLNLKYARLPICIPLLPEYAHIRPQIGERVLVILENPNDLTSKRYWIGPLISQQVNLEGQSYSSSEEMFNQNNFSQKNTASNPTTGSLNKAAIYYPQPSETAFQGKQDADITFAPRYAITRVGRFKKGTTELNKDTPCYLEIKQVDSETKNPNSIKIFDKLASATSTFKSYSQANLHSTNINIYSLEGKFKSAGADVEISERLKDFGDIANKLHPTVFGDELIKLLKLILTYLTTHIHPPQSPAIPDGTSAQLTPYLSGNKMQDMISNVVRIN